MASGFDLLVAIDLRGGLVVRLRQGDFARETAFSDDPVAVARGFVEAGAPWLHVVDLDGTRLGRPVHAAIIASVVAAAGERARVEIAGGLRDPVALTGALASGAARAVIGTAALEDPLFVERSVTAHGHERIVAAIDVRDGKAVGHGWKTGAAGIDAAETIGRLADAGLTIFEVTAIERDGLLEGPDLALYERLVRLDRGSVIASGGIARLDDLRGLRDVGCAGAIVGRALYERRLDLRQAIAAVGGST